MNEDAPTPQTPTAEQCRAIVLSLLVVVSVVAATAVVPGPVAAASDNATVTLGSTDPGVMTTHNWSITADGASGQNLKHVSLIYIGTGTNVSAVGAGDVAISVDGQSVGVDSVTAQEGDEVLQVALSSAPAVNQGDVVTVKFLTDVVKNPTVESTHSGNIGLYNESYAEISEGSTGFVIGSGGTGTIDGQVTNAADGTPVESADVEVADGDGVVGMATTDATGNYSIDVPAGTYDVSVYHQSYETSTTSEVIVGDGETVTVDATLTAGGEMEADPASVTLGSTDPGAMTTHNWSITANGASGEQLNRIQLYYTGSGTNFSAAGIDDIEIAVDGATIGASALEDIGDENLSVVLTTPVAVNGGDEVTVNFLADVVENPTIKSSHYASIGLLGSQEVGAISSGYDGFVIGGAGTIDGRVTNSSDGTEIDGAQVQAIDSEGMATSTVTNATGYYDITVAAGTYDVSVSHAEYDSNTTNGVSVVSGETTTVDVSLASAAFSVVDTSVEYVSGTRPDQIPTVRSYETNLAGISLLNESHGQDLASLGVAPDTELRVNATIQGLTPRQMIGTIRDASWEVTDVDGDRVNVTIVGKPASAQYMLDAPSLDNWPDDGTDSADMKYEQMWDVAFDDMEHGGLSAAELEQVNGSILATDAQAFSMPSYDEGPEGGAGALSIEIGGPHLTVDGTENQGFFEGFIPDAQLDAWNVTNPETELAANYAGRGVDGMTVTSVDGGAEFEFPVHYSAGEVSMTAGDSSSDPATFDVMVEETNAPVVEGSTLTVDVTVENAGDETATQDVALADFAGTAVDTVTVSDLAGGDSESITLRWNTAAGDAGSGDITVASENDGAVASVTIEEDGGSGGLPAPPPAEPALSIVDLAASVTTVVVGEPVSVDVTVENAGSAEGTQELALEIDGEVVDRGSLTVSAGEEVTSTFSHAFDAPGSHDVSVNGQVVGTVDVESDDGKTNEGAAEADGIADEDGDEDRSDSTDDSVPGFTPIATLLGLLYVGLRHRSSTS